MVELTLTEQATNIINSKAQCIDDILELSRISYMMSLQYKKAKDLLGEKSYKYNITRVEESRKARKEGQTAGDSEQIGKLKAEIGYGDYRKSEESLVGMKEVIKQIDQFRIAWYVKEKGVDQILKSGS